MRKGQHSDTRASASLGVAARPRFGDHHDGDGHVASAGQGATHSRPESVDRESAYVVAAALTDKGVAGDPDSDHGQVGEVKDPPEQWEMMGQMLGWPETAARCASEATTLGVVSALLAGITFPGLLTRPVPPDDFTGPVPAETLIRLYMYFCMASILSSVVCVIVCCTLIMQLNICCTPAHIRDFFGKYQRLTVLNVGCFNMSLAMFIATMACITAIQYNYTDAIIAVSVVLTVWLALAVFVSNLYMNFTMAKIKANYVAYVRMSNKLHLASKLSKRAQVHPVGGLQRAHSGSERGCSVRNLADEDEFGGRDAQSGHSPG